MTRDHYTETYWTCPVCDQAFYLVITTRHSKPLFRPARIRIVRDDWQDTVLAHLVAHLEALSS